MRYYLSAKFLIVLFAMLYWGSLCAQEQRTEDLRFGSVAMDIPAEMYRRLAPLSRYLSEYHDISVNLSLSPNLPHAISAVSAGDVDIAYLSPVAYINARAAGEVRLVVKTMTDGEGVFNLSIVVRDASPIRTIEELKGKSFAFGDPAALLQRAVVVGAGLKLEELSRYEFVGHYDEIARAVSDGEFDAGILYDSKAWQWESKGLRVLYQSDNLPSFVVVVASHVEQDTLERLRESFLQLDINNPAHQQIILALDARFTGFSVARDEEYDVIRKMVAPFQDAAQ